MDWEEEMDFFGSASGDYLAECKAHGECAVIRMSAKAREGYVAGGGEITLYEYTTEDGETVYAVQRDDRQSDDMTFGEVEDMLELMADATRLASRIRAHDKWTDCIPSVEELCELADLGVEWARACDQWEDVIYRAAERLGVKVI